VLLDVDVKVIMMRLIRTGTEDRREPAAGRHPQGCECRIRRGVGFGLDAQGRSIGEVEAGDADRKPLRMGRELARRRPVPVAALEAWASLDGFQVASLDAGDEIADPVPERPGEAAGQDQLIGQAD
jgi:hypothetical protein